MSWGVGLAWDDVLWDLPSAVVGVCYLNSQPILGFKAVDRQPSISQNYCVNYKAVQKKKKKSLNRLTRTDATQFGSNNRTHVK